MNHLYYGDNLSVLRESIASVDLVYLDPPFNSNASYNVLFKAPSGEGSQAQIEAFEDTWHWNESAERAFDEVVTGPHSDASIMLRAMRSALGESDMMAYLAMMFTERAWFRNPVSENPDDRSGPPEAPLAIIAAAGGESIWNHPPTAMAAA